MTLCGTGAIACAPAARPLATLVGLHDSCGRRGAPSPLASRCVLAWRRVRYAAEAAARRWRPARVCR